MTMWNKYKISKKDNLNYRGIWDEKLFEKTLAIVGSRRMTRYAESVIDKIMPELVANNITIISGFMYGVDTYAHKICLELGGKTIAILGGGLNYLCPPENEKLYSEIIEKGGLVISEFPNDFIPTLWSFPQRNKTVAKLSTEGILVIEAGIKSGSLVTANLGFKMGKKIFAVPGPITSSVSAGTNLLIKTNMAKMFTGVCDILETNAIIEQKKLFTTADEIERKIIEVLMIEELTLDEICHKTGTNVSELCVKLSMLSMKNVVDERNGKYFLV